jgi:predicted Zn finger-like uncharacterized protein
MLIVCPNCAASYQVSATSIGAAGRSVRCLRCRTIWFERPPAEVPVLAVSQPPVLAEAAASDETVAAFRTELGGEASPPSPAEAHATIADPPPVEAPASVTNDADGPTLDDLMAANVVDAGDGADRQATDDTEAPPAEVALADNSIPAADAPPLAPMAPEVTTLTAADAAQAAPAEDIESIAARRRKRSTARRRHSMQRGRLPAVILALVAVIAALIAWRADVVRNAPQLASLYGAIGLPVNLRGLAFTQVTIAKDSHDGMPVLLVEGTIASTASKPVEVPRLRIALRNAAGGEVYAWTAVPTRTVLEPGETLPFRSRLASPPNDGHDVVVRFFTRRDAVAGLN